MATFLRWGEREMHRRFGTENFMVMGTIGSGKTVLLDMLKRSVFAQDANGRKLVYDPKAEMLSSLFHLAGDGEETARRGDGKVKVLNPFDLRGAAWRVASDIDGPLAANAFAEVLMPVEHDSGESRFYDETVRSLLATLTLSLIDCVPNARAWTFRDLILSVMWEPYTRFILEMDRTRDGRPFPDASRLRKVLFEGDERVMGNIRATVNAKLRNYPIVASCFHAAERAGRTFSLSEWAAEGCDDVLVVGTDDAAKGTVDAINRAVFQRAFELLLSKPGKTTRERRDGTDMSYVVLDELAHAGRLDKLELLLTKGRSNNVGTAIGFQDIGSLKEHYGPDVANVIIGMCANVAVLRLNSAETAEFAASLFGRRPRPNGGTSQSMDSDGKLNQGRDDRLEDQPYVYSADLLYLPPTGPEAGLTGYFKSPDVDPEAHDLRVHLDWVREIAPFLPPESEPQPGSWRAARMPRPLSDHYLLPWDAEDWTRLGFRCPVPDWSGTAPQAPPASHKPPQHPLSDEDPRDGIPELGD